MAHSVPTRRSSDRELVGHREDGVGLRRLVVEVERVDALQLHNYSPRLLPPRKRGPRRSEEHTSELQSLMRTSYAVFCLTKKSTRPNHAYCTIMTHRQTTISSIEPP